MQPKPKSPRSLPAPTVPGAGGPDFQGVEFLAGGTWYARSPGGIFYRETVEKTLNGWFLGSLAVSRGETWQKVTQGMLGVDASSQLLRMWGFRSDGAVIELEQEKRNPPGATSWVLVGTCLGQTARQTLTRTGPNGMKTVTELFVKGEWQATPPLPYRRAY